jgi:type IV secretory pathway VirB10-like protein
MKFAIYTAVLLLVLGTTTSAFAQKDEKGNSEGAKPAQQARPAAKPAQQHTQQTRPAQQQHAQQTNPAPQNQQHAQRTNPAPQQQQQAQQAKPAQRQQVQQSRPAPQQGGQQTQVRNGNNGGGDHGRISDAHYRASFGSSHSFHVNQGEFNNRRFQYGGYWFGFGAPWPAGWLYTDDVYVEYIDGGYYMFDPYHPGIRLSISIM